MEKRWLAAVAIAAMLVSPLLGKKSAKDSGGAEQQIQKLEEQTKEASLKNDTAWFEKTLADDFIGVGGTGLVSDKASTIAARKNGDLKYEGIEVTDSKVRVYGNTAVANGTATVKGSMKGEDFSGTYHYVRVYVKQGGQWKVVHFQATKASS